MSINRKTGPAISPIDDIQLPEVSFYTLGNGVPVYEVNTGTQEAFKLEILTLGGRLNESKKMVSRATASLIPDATHEYSQKELAEKLDYYGAALSSKFNMDVTSLILYSLNKHAGSVLPLVASIYLRPAFSEEELQKYIVRSIHNLEVELNKNDVLAYREYTEQLFGKDHIYGYNSTAPLYKDLNVNDLKDHHDRQYGIQNTVIILSGYITDKIRDIVDTELGSFKKASSSLVFNYPVPNLRKSRITLTGKGKVQDSIIIGRRLFNKQHPDYSAIILANTILGGYFGSRLMKVVREEKGYTYNIGSYLDILRYDGFYYISTDVAPENTDDCIDEIHRQINILQDQMVSEGELTMVKNYILGNILNMLDGSFKVSGWIKTLVTHDVSLLRGHEIIQEIQQIDGQQVKNVFQKYYQPQDLLELIVKA
jgi:zinc protease